MIPPADHMSKFEVALRAQHQRGGHCLIVLIRVGAVRSCAIAEKKGSPESFSVLLAMEGRAAVFEAAKTGDVDAIRSALDAGFSVNAQEVRGIAQQTVL